MRQTIQRCGYSILTIALTAMASVAGDPTPDLVSAPKPVAPALVREEVPPMPLIPDRFSVPRAADSTGGFYAGGGVLLLSPYINNNTAFTVINPPVPSAPGAFPLAVASARTVPFNWNCEPGWQAWAGWSSECGWGAQARVFVFDHSSDQLTLTTAPGAIPPIVTVPDIIPAIPGTAAFAAPSSILGAAGIGTDRLVFSSDLQICSADFEATYKWCAPDCLARVSGGLRVMSIKHGYHALLTNPGDGVTSEFQRLDANADFNGAGPTVGLFLRKGLCDCGLAAYGNVRGSIVFGQVERTAAYAQDVNDPTLVGLVGSSQTRTRFDERADCVVTVGEIELGLEYETCVYGKRLFVRGGVVGQTYLGAGSASSSTGNLGMLGGTASIGVNY